ncbi:putative bifunctional diguanylate cyclase/phosphodiesterase [Arthrobacter sp. D3-16]
MQYLRDAVQEGWRPDTLPSGNLPSADLLSPEPVASAEPVSAVLLGRALDTVSEGSLITDANQNIVYANKAFEAVTGYSPEEMLGLNCRVLQGPGSDPETIAMMRAVLARGETFRCEILNYRKNGTPFWNGLTISALRDTHNLITHFVSVQRDVTSQRSLQEQLRFLALHDPVTGLPNRTALDQYLSKERCPNTQVTAVGIIDLDDFKDVNDAYGHEAGDALLADFAHRLQRRTRDQDFLARLGGDEFVVVINSLTPESAEEELRHILEALHDAVDTNFTIGPGVRARVRMSMGLALCPPGAYGGSAALRRADTVLYRQKALKNGRDRWWHLDDFLPPATGDEHTLKPVAPVPDQKANGVSAELAGKYRNRLFDGGLRMHFQPIVDLRTNGIYCVEALTRLVLEDGSVVPAGKFLPLLSPEEINALLRAGLDEALSQLTAWDRLGHRLSVSVNLSPFSLSNPDCARWVATALNRHSISPERLTLELLETHTADETAQQQTIQELLDLGVGLALDDLGSGHSTLLRLTVLPFNTVKIDRQLLRQFTTAPIKTMTFLTTMIHMGQDMGWATVAEGLEDATLTEVMRVLGVPYGQGFHLARPMPSEHIPAWITAARTPTGQDLLVTTYAGALAYHWQFNRLKTPHTGALQACPLTAFLTGQPGSETAVDLHRKLHAGSGHNTEACNELLAWFVDHVTVNHEDAPVTPFRQPALMETHLSAQGESLTRKFSGQGL